MSSEQDIFRVAGSSRTIEPMPLVADMLRMSSSGTYAYTQMMDYWACVCVLGHGDQRGERPHLPGENLIQGGSKVFFFFEVLISELSYNKHFNKSFSFHGVTQSR